MQRPGGDRDVSKFEEQPEGQCGRNEVGRRKVGNEVRERSVDGTWTAKVNCSGPESSTG